MNKRHLQAQHSKQRIFSSAQELFKKYGFENVTIDDICSHAKVSKGLFYNYFTSKAEIISISVEPLNQRYDSFMESLDPDLDTSEKLCLLLRCILENTILDMSIQTSARLDYALEVSDASRESIIFNPDRSLFKYIEDIVLLGQEKDEIAKSVSAESIKNLMFRYAVGSIIYLFSIKDTELQKQIIDSTVSDFSLICSAFQ